LSCRNKYLREYHDKRVTSEQRKKQEAERERQELFARGKRRCSKCNRVLPATTEYFYRDRTASNGLSCICAKCSNKAAKQWHADNLEHAHEYRKRRAKEHPEALLLHRVLRAEKIAETKRNWRRNNPDKVKKHKSDSQKRNRDAANRRSKRWRKAHPEKAREETRIQGHRRSHASGVFTKADIERQLRAQTDKKGIPHCWWCGKVLKPTVKWGDRTRIGYDIDHVIPISRGGTNDPSNLVLSCPHCNDRKGAKLPSEWNGRLL